MGGARLAIERDRTWEPDRGEVVRGRNGRDDGGVQALGFGEDMEGSVDRRSSGRESVEELWSRRLGRGEGWNSSILSVSGTGSIVACLFSGSPICHLSGEVMGVLTKGSRKLRGGQRSETCEVAMARYGKVPPYC